MNISQFLTLNTYVLLESNLCTFFAHIPQCGIFRVDNIPLWQRLIKMHFLYHLVVLFVEKSMDYTSRTDGYFYANILLKPI